MYILNIKYDMNISIHKNLFDFDFNIKIKINWKISKEIEGNRRKLIAVIIITRRGSVTAVSAISSTLYIRYDKFIIIYYTCLIKYCQITFGAELTQ